jgi:hypothetical protein
MYAVGVIEILAGLLVALMARYGGLPVAAWLAGIVVNLMAIPGYYDVALRDFGLSVSALALSKLAWGKHLPTLRGTTRQRTAAGGPPAPPDSRRTDTNCRH